MKREVLGSNKEDHYKVIHEMHTGGQTYYQIANFLNGVGITQENGEPVHDKAISKFMLLCGYRIKIREQKAKRTKDSVIGQIETILLDKKISRLMKLSLISKYVE